MTNFVSTWPLISHQWKSCYPPRCWNIGFKCTGCCAIFISLDLNSILCIYINTIYVLFCHVLQHEVMQFLWLFPPVMFLWCKSAFYQVIPCFSGCLDKKGEHLENFGRCISYKLILFSFLQVMTGHNFLVSIWC